MKNNPFNKDVDPSGAMAKETLALMEMWLDGNLDAVARVLQLMVMINGTQRNTIAGTKPQSENGSGGDAAVH